MLLRLRLRVGCNIFFGLQFFINNLNITWHTAKLIRLDNVESVDNIFDVRLFIPNVIIFTKSYSKIKVLLLPLSCLSYVVSSCADNDHLSKVRPFFAVSFNDHVSIFSSFTKLPLREMNLYNMNDRQLWRGMCVTYIDSFKWMNTRNETCIQFHWKSLR